MIGEEVQVKKGQRICSVDGCEKKHTAKGYCRTHYYRWKAGMPKDAVESLDRLKYGRKKLGGDWVVLIRLSSMGLLDWVRYLKEHYDLDVHRNAIYQARSGKTYGEIPMDHEELLKEAERRGLDLPE